MKPIRGFDDSRLLVKWILAFAITSNNVPATLRLTGITNCYDAPHGAELAPCRASAPDSLPGHKKPMNISMGLVCF